MVQCFSANVSISFSTEGTILPPSYEITCLPQFKQKLQIDHHLQRSQLEKSRFGNQSTEEHHGPWLKPNQMAEIPYPPFSKDPYAQGIMDLTLEKMWSFNKQGIVQLVQSVYNGSIIQLHIWFEIFYLWFDHPILTIKYTERSNFQLSFDFKISQSLFILISRFLRMFLTPCQNIFHIIQ